MDNSALAEPVFFEQVAHDVVVSVCINADVAGLRETELKQGIHHAVGRWRACNAVNDVVWERVVQPFAVVDGGVGRVWSGNEGKGGDWLGLSVAVDSFYQIAVPVVDVISENFSSGMTFCPLVLVACSQHGLSCLIA